MLLFLLAKIMYYKHVLHNPKKLLVCNTNMYYTMEVDEIYIEEERFGMLLKFGGDSGFDGYKGVFRDKDGKLNDFYIPHAIYKVEADRFDENPEPPTNILDELKVEIRSEALTGGCGLYIVGEAATQEDMKEEFIRGAKKWNSDNHLIMHMVATAYAAITTGDYTEGPDGTLEVEAILGTGLPVEEYKQEDQRKEFKRKLAKNIHLVKFSGDAHDKAFAGKTVRIKYKKVAVANEAAATHLVLSEDENGQPRHDKPHTKRNYLIVTIGGGTMEIAPVVNGKPDLRKATSEPFGINPVIDDIRKQLAARDVFLPRRQDFIQIALRAIEDEDYGYKVIKSGTTVVEEFDDLVKAKFVPLANTAITHIKKALNSVMGIEAIEILGGTPIILKPFLDEKAKKEQLNLIYQENAKLSRFTLAIAYHRIAEQSALLLAKGV